MSQSISSAIREITCIGCPNGCQVRVTLSAAGKIFFVEGNQCPIGKKYAEKECTAPERTITTLVVAADGQTPVPVKTDRPVPKAQIFACLNEIHACHPALPLDIGDVILEDVCGTGVKLVATRALPGK